MEAFFPAYLQSTSRPDPRIEVRPSVKIINNRHCIIVNLEFLLLRQQSGAISTLQIFVISHPDVILDQIFFYWNTFTNLFFLSLVRFVRILVGLGQRTSLVLVLCLGWGWSSQSLDMRPHDMVTVFVRKLCYSLNQTLLFVHNMLSFPRAQLWWSDTNSEQRFID